MHLLSLATRLVLPAWHPVLERVYIYKTAHHPRLETDYKQPAIDAAMATAAAPTFLKPPRSRFPRRQLRPLLSVPVKNPRGTNFLPGHFSRPSNCENSAPGKSNSWLL